MLTFRSYRTLMTKLSCALNFRDVEELLLNGASRFLRDRVTMSCVNASTRIHVSGRRCRFRDPDSCEPTMWPAKNWMRDHVSDASRLVIISGAFRKAIRALNAIKSRRGECFARHSTSDILGRLGDGSNGRHRGNIRRGCLTTRRNQEFLSPQSQIFVAVKKASELLFQVRCGERLADRNGACE